MSKMKKLEELGISPAPWSKVFDEFGDEEAQYQVAVADSRFPVGASTLSGDYCEADAMLIAASPELYDAGQKTEAVLTGLFKLDEFAALLKSGAADALIACRDELRKALAKASGEGDVK